jgi:hypothetical protein
VVPQLLARPTFIEQLDGLAIAVGATFHEVVLLDSRENMLRRFADRARTSAGAHAEAGPEELSELYDRLMALLADRPGARTVHVEPGDETRTYRALLRTLEKG